MAADERSPSAAKERAALERALAAMDEPTALIGPATDGEGMPTEREWLEGVAADRLPDPAQKALQTWVGRIKEAEREDATLFGIVLPGDSSLAVVLVGMEEAAYAGDPEFDSRVPVSAAVSPAEPPERVRVPEGAGHPAAPGEGPPADPSVSPADTIRRALERAKSLAVTGTPTYAAYREATDALAELLAAGERDRRQIARLTEALKRAAQGPCLNTMRVGGCAAALIARKKFCPSCTARAVLADEEDAANGRDDG